MKIIDKKGKLFGIINVIDLAVILILGLAIVGGTYRFKKASPQMVSKNQKAIVTAVISEVRQPTVDGIEVGDELYHYDKGQRFGKVIDMEVESYKTEVETSDGKVVLAEVPGRYTINLTIESDAVNSTDSITIGGEQTRIGTEYRLKSKKIAAFATIFKVDLEGEK